jgi:hypothetical protein
MVSGRDPELAIEALYSLAYQDEEEAAKIFHTALTSSRFSAVKAHALLAMADSSLADRFSDQTYRALEDKDPLIRSAAALALKGLADGETPMRIAEILESEQRPSVVSDLLLVLGLTGGAQHQRSAQRWVGRARDENIAKLAERVVKVLSGKLDSQVLEECYQRRLSEPSLSGRWHFRLRDEVTKEIYKGLELDRIIRKDLSAGDSEGGTSEDTPTGGDEESGGEEENQGSSTEGDGLNGGQDVSSPPQGSSGGEDPSQTKKFLFRREVIEWDLLLWFNHYPYFPQSFFQGK